MGREGEKEGRGYDDVRQEAKERGGGDGEQAHFTIWLLLLSKLGLVSHPKKLISIVKPLALRTQNISHSVVKSRKLVLLDGSEHCLVPTIFPIFK